MQSFPYFPSTRRIWRRKGRHVESAERKRKLGNRALVCRSQRWPLHAGVCIWLEHKGYRETQTTELPSQAPDGNVHKFTSNSLQPLRCLEDMIDLTFGLPRRDVLILPTSTLHFLMSSAFHHQTNIWAENWDHQAAGNLHVLSVLHHLTDTARDPRVRGLNSIRSHFQITSLPHP